MRKTSPDPLLKKVFGIGFHKTATSSLALALMELGYRVTGPNGAQNPDIEHDVYGMARSLIAKYDAFQDNPWPMLYRQVDQWCPESKFILTIRPKDAWIESVIKHFQDGSTPMRKWIYGVGSPKGNEDVYIKKYELHQQEVMHYFKNRSNDLLVMRVTEGDGWDLLCPFLQQVSPDTAFPHANKYEDRMISSQAGDG